MNRRGLDNHALRRNGVIAFFGLVALLLAWRAVYLQTAQHERLQRYSEDIAVREVKTSAHRGMITDVNGEPLAISTPVQSAWAEPRVLMSHPAQLEKLAGLIETDVAHLKTILEPRIAKDFVYLKRHLPPDASAAIEEAAFAGVHLKKEYRRYYPTAEVTSHLLGFTNVDDQGQEGVELAFDSYLAGRPGIKRVVRDRRGRTIEHLEELEQVRPGADLRLSIDRRLQYVTYRELKSAVGKHRAVSGSIVVLDARTGEILALANQPSFNPNTRKGLIGEYYRNRALTDVFEPGSTLKPFTVAAALESGAFRPDSVVDTAPGHFSIGRHVVRDIRNRGRISVAEIIRYSSNVGASKLALSMDGETLWSAFRRFGFGSGTGSGLPGESAGKFTHHSNWSEIEQATLAFGYGMSVTVLQLARAYQAIANDGMMRTLSVQADSDVIPEARVMSADTARALREMLEVVVEAGTGREARLAGYSVAGKTGTVHKLTRDGYAESRYRSLFAGMVPAGRPRLVAAVVIDEPREGAYFGGDVAAPVFANVMRAAARIVNIPPDRPGELEAPAVQLAAGDGSR